MSKCSFTHHYERMSACSKMLMSDCSYAQLKMRKLLRSSAYSNYYSFLRKHYLGQMSCRYCGKQFNRGFNLRRHEKEYCSLREQEENMFENNYTNDTDYSQDDESDESEAMTSENESEAEGEETDPWFPIIDEAKERVFDSFKEMKDHLMSTGLDEETAKNEASFKLLPKLQRELGNIYKGRLEWIQEMKRDPVHMKIMQTKKDFMENDDFEPEEALEAAIDKRKFLIRKLLKNYDIFSEKDDSDNED